MHWSDHIHSDPAICFGKPVLRGTRLSVEFILGLYAVGWTTEQIIDNYPGVTPDRLRAIFAFATEVVKDEALLAVAAPHKAE